MIEINVFIDSLKVTWIRKMLKEDKCRWIALLKKDVPDLDLQKYSGSRFLFSKRSAVNPFWHDDFSSFARFSERCIPQTISEFLQEPILFHHKIKIEGTVISRQVWRRLGIRTIGQLTSENFEFLEYSRFITKFGNDINFLEHYGIIKAIKKYKESLHLKDEPSPNTTEAKPYAVLQSERKGTKAIRNILRQNIRLLPKAGAKWNNTFLDLDWPAIYSSLKNSTSDTRLKWFQYRILHRVLTTNDYLYKRKVIDSDGCTFCKTEKGNNKSPPLGLHLHRDLLEAHFRMDHKEYTSCTLSQYHGAVGYFWRKSRRNNEQGT